MEKGFYSAIATLIGGIVGAGLFGIPYVFAKAGFLTAMISFLIISIVVLFLHLAVGEIVLRTKEKHQLVGYANKYLGKCGKYFMLFVFLFILYGSLIIYSIGAGQALNAIYQYNLTSYIIIFYFILSIILFFGLKIFEGSELILNIVKMVILAAIFLWMIKTVELNYDNLSMAVNPRLILLPFGALIFAFLGAAIIPEMSKELGKNKDKLLATIILGTIIPLIFYFIFAFLTVSALGENTTEIATIGLGKLGYSANILLNVFVLFAMTTGFISWGFVLKEMYIDDYKLNNLLSWLLTITVPMIFILLGTRSFIKSISIVGSVAGSLEIIMVMLILWQAKKYGDRKPEYSMSKNVLLFLLIILITIISLVSTFI